MQISTRIGVLQAIASFPKVWLSAMILVRGGHRRKPDAALCLHGAAQHAGAYRLARVEPESIREFKKLDEVYAALSALPSRATND
jgi:hypothetical protein